MKISVTNISSNCTTSSSNYEESWHDSECLVGMRNEEEEPGARRGRWVGGAKQNERKENTQELFDSVRGL